MKKISLFLLAIVLQSTILMAQNYFINFTATGPITTIDSVKVENLTQNKSLTIYGADVLNLVPSSGIESYEENKNNINVFPNPMQGQAEIRFNAKQSGKIQIAINDISGKEIIQKNEDCAQGIHRYNLSGLKTGIYFVKITGKGYSYNVKMISHNTNTTETALEYVGVEKTDNQNATQNHNKSANTVKQMNFAAGNFLRYTAYSSNLVATVSEVPTTSKTINFTFIQAQLATISTNSISNINSYSATCGGNITADGGNAVTARGVCWSTGTNPTITANQTTDGSGGGSFASEVTGLIGNTKYYVRAYATTSSGTAYGMAMSFTTLASVLPILTTTTINKLTQTTAASGGNISTDGGASIITRGVCWSTKTKPTIADIKTTDGAGATSFTSSISNLIQGTVYYLRAYATNSVGTAYGNEINFKTPFASVDFNGTTLYVSPMDNAHVQWGGYLTLTNAASDTDGATNTSTIVNSIKTNGGVSYAAKVCDTLTLGGFNDWYLPSKNELNVLYLNKNSIGGFITVNENISNSYWSSTEAGSKEFSYYQNFKYGRKDSGVIKTENLYVRCVRK